MFVHSIATCFDRCLFCLSSPKGICFLPSPVFAVILSAAKDPGTIGTTYTARTFSPAPSHRPGTIFTEAPVLPEPVSLVKSKKSLIFNKRKEINVPIGSIQYALELEVKAPVITGAFPLFL
jgi:hypothetical protein